MDNFQRRSPDRDGRPPDRGRRPNGAYNCRGRPLTDGLPRFRFPPSSNSRTNRGFRMSGPYGREPSIEAPPRGNQSQGFAPGNRNFRNDEDYFNPNTPPPSIIYYPPPPRQPDSYREFQTVPVFSGPFPINHIPVSHPASNQIPVSHSASGRFNETPVVLGPFPLQNIPYIPGSIPIHHIPYIPGPENVPHCPVLYEAEDNDPNLTYPGYTILVPVPYGALPAVQLYIFPSNYIDGPNFVLIFQHGYMMPPRAHIFYFNTGDGRNPREYLQQMSCANQTGQAENDPPIGMRIGRQRTPMRIQRGRGRIYNRITRNQGYAHNMTFRYTGQTFGHLRRRGNARSFLQEHFRGNTFERDRGMPNGRPLHSCGSNDPTHNCLWDQRRRNSPMNKRNNPGKPEPTQPFAILKAPVKYVEKREVPPPKKTGDALLGLQPTVPKALNKDEEKKDIPDASATSKPIPQKGILKPPRKTEDKQNNNKLDIVVANEAIEGASSKIEEASSKIEEASSKIEEASSKIEEASSKIEEASSKIEEAPSQIEEASTKIEEATTKIEEASTKIEEASTKIEEASSKIEESDGAHSQNALVDAPPEDSITEDPIPEDEVPKKKEKNKKSSSKKPSSNPNPNPEDSGEASSSTTQRKSRYRPTYNYLRNPKRDGATSEKVKIRNYDEKGNRVPTYRQAVHYCTKYHEKQSRKKLRKQRNNGIIIPNPYNERSLLDDWLGDCTTSESDSDSSFLTDEGGDQTKPPNTKEMLAYYYEIKALKEEEKKKKKKK